MGNVELARRLIADVRAAGVREFCVCAGSRNSPLLYVLGRSDARLFSFVDERSAAFFALGRSKQHGVPVAVVTTSGTAVAELLPATVEAYYSGIPLVLLTADRPARFRGTAAPQSIEQVGLFGLYAETSLEGWSGVRPLHLNIEFDEPLIDELAVGGAAAASAAECRRPAAEAAAAPQDDVAFDRPLVIVGGLRREHRERVRRFLLQLKAPVFAEPLSGLREDGELPLITGGERMVTRGRFDGVIRIGNIPTLRFWRDLETKPLPVVHYSDLPFTGLSEERRPPAGFGGRGPAGFGGRGPAGGRRSSVSPIDALPGRTGTRDEAFFEDDRRMAERIAAILDDEPHSELAMLRALSHELPENTRIYLGNSLPIREWDLVATRAKRFEYEANRGANGIDGQLSTFFGWCAPDAENVAVVGDLTALYDLNAPWIVPQLEAGTRFRIVIVNNGGGRIFSRVASLRDIDTPLRERIIENVHGLRFEQWAAMWSLDKKQVTELVPDEAASRRAWERYDALWR